MCAISGRVASVLFDTDVLIWVFRANVRAATLIEQTEERNVSVVTYIELMQGARDRGELRRIKRFLSDFGFNVYPLTENIGHRAAIYVEEYGLSGSMTMADALIAATAVETSRTLVTGNQKHYRPVKELHLKSFRPWWTHRSRTKAIWKMNTSQ